MIFRGGRCLVGIAYARTHIFHSLALYDLERLSTFLFSLIRMLESSIISVCQQPGLLRAAPTHVESEKSRQ